MNKKQLNKALASIQKSADVINEDAEQLAEELSEFIESKSDTWREGTSGEEYQMVLEQLQDISVEIDSI